MSNYWNRNWFFFSSLRDIQVCTTPLINQRRLINLFYLNNPFSTTMDLVNGIIHRVRFLKAFKSWFLSSITTGPEEKDEVIQLQTPLILTHLWKTLFFSKIAVTTIRSKLYDVENQRAPKLALLGCGMDVSLVFLMYDHYKLSNSNSSASRRMMKSGSSSTRSKICSSGHDHEIDAWSFFLHTFRTLHREYSCSWEFALRDYNTN